MEGLCGSGDVEVEVLCFCFHEADLRALSEGLDIPNDFAIWANNLSKNFTLPPEGTYVWLSKSPEWAVLQFMSQLPTDPCEITLNRLCAG